MLPSVQQCLASEQLSMKEGELEVSPWSCMYQLVSSVLHKPHCIAVLCVTGDLGSCPFQNTIIEVPYGPDNFQHRQSKLSLGSS